MCAYVSIIKYKQNLGWKCGNFGGKLKLYGTSKQKEKKAYGRKTETAKRNEAKYGDVDPVKTLAKLRADLSNKLADTD